MARPFRFGVLVMNPVGSGSDLGERCEALERMGYDVLLFSDHLDRSPVAPIAALAFAAARTERVRLGALVLNNDLRHPAVLAKELATLDLLSGGRLEVGLGAGWMDSDYDRSGIRKDPGPVRVDRLAEAVAVLKRALSARDPSAPAPPALRGVHYSVAGEVDPPAPVQRPRPPLLLGGSGRRVLSLAAREADIVSLNWDLRAGAVTAGTVRSSTGPALADRLSWIAEAAAQRARAPELGLTTFFGRVTSDVRAAASQLAAQWAVDVPPEDILGHPHALIGSVPAIVDELRRRREAWGVSYITVYDGVAGSFAPVVEQLSGR